ncbi:MAG: universal stress protein [Hylemonella sp.]|nr:universal stress protein [Hylemonella sp.]
MYKKILVATDGSKLAQTAVDHGIKLAALTGAELVATQITPRYPKSYFEGSLPLSSEEVKRIEAQWGESAQSVLEAVKEAGKAKGVKVKTVQVKSDLIADAIVAAAKKNNVDLIIMASHGRKGIKRLLLGSETQHVLAQATVPVLVLR